MNLRVAVPGTQLTPTVRSKAGWPVSTIHTGRSWKEEEGSGKLWVGNSNPTVMSVKVCECGRVGV